MKSKVVKKNKKMYKVKVSMKKFTDLLLVVLFLFSSINIFSQTNTHLFYGESNNPRFRELAPSSTYWLTEQSIPTLTNHTIHFMRVASCPLRDEKVIVTLASDQTLKVTTWSATGGWGQPFTLRSGATPTNCRWFDVVYEQQSGRCMVVYSTGNHFVAYRIFENGNWSSQQTVYNYYTDPGQTNKKPLWLSLAAKPNSNEIVAVWMSENDRWGYAAVSIGSTLISTDTICGQDMTGDSVREGFMVVYEHQSGQAV
ncbi:MAG: hypothetical protein ABDH23_07360, partial [Endomicrobiia bacterium]